MGRIVAIPVARPGMRTVLTVLGVIVAVAVADGSPCLPPLLPGHKKRMALQLCCIVPTSWYGAPPACLHNVPHPKALLFLLNVTLPCHMPQPFLCLTGSRDD